MLGKYSGRNSLPEEGYGFEPATGDASRSPKKKKRSSGSIPSTSGEFSFEFFEADNGLGPAFSLIYGKAVHDNVTVGKLCGDLVNRKGNFFGTCQQRSHELLDLARFCANADGTLRRPLCAKIRDEARVRAAGRGGLLFLDEVHFLPAYRGRDLSLEFIHALLRYLGRRWTLAMTAIMPWDYGDQQEQEARTDEERMRLCRHFARAGFRQANDTYWYLDAAKLPAQPQPRAAVAALAVWLPAKEIEPTPLSELDQKLVDAVEQAKMLHSADHSDDQSDDQSAAGTQQTACLEQVAALLKAGASIEASCAVHCAVSGVCEVGERWRPDALRLLLDARASVNHVDPTGRTPLHVAAHCSGDTEAMSEPMSEAAIRVLLECGADPLARAYGFTPLDEYTQTTTRAIQSLRDFRMAHDELDEEADEEAMLAEVQEEAETVLRLLPCSLLLQRATAARYAQLDHRECLVKCLMYDRDMSVDLLRRIHSLVEPPQPEEYSPPTGFLRAGTPVQLGALSKAILNGAEGQVIGTDLPTGRYMVQLCTGHPPIKVKPENVLPLDEGDEASDSEGGDYDDDIDDLGEDDDDDDGEEDPSLDSSFGALLQTLRGEIKKPGVAQPNK